ncbi:MAG: hypothetical protein AB1486_30365 [Planctomycetota bacterium]
MTHASSILLAISTTLLIAGVAWIPSPADRLKKAQDQYRECSQKASSAWLSQVSGAGQRLIEAYDSAIRSARAVHTDPDLQSLRRESAQVAAALERMQKEGPGDRILELLSLLDGCVIAERLPRKGMVAYYGFNEGRGRVTLDAVSKAPHSVPDATWVKEPGAVGLDFRVPAAILSELDVALGASWTVVIRTRCPLDTTGRQWSTLMVAGPGKHHAIVNSRGEVGIYLDRFLGSGLNLTGLSGWRTLIIRVDEGRTELWLDGDLKGTVPAAVNERIQAFGNVPWLGEGPQNCGAPVDGFVVYSRALTPQEITALGDGPI